ncbi:MAG: 30S ribosomal protein S6 [bacterium]|nr:30S ribosomal protein S6 [bacterium]
MKEYENLVIFDPDINEEIVDKKITVLKDLLSQKDDKMSFAIDKWGLKTLAYPIKKKDRGFFVLLKFSVIPDALPELIRELKLSSEIMRYSIDVMEPPKKPSSASAKTDKAPKKE